MTVVSIVRINGSYEITWLDSTKLVCHTTVPDTVELVTWLIQKWDEIT